VNVGAGERYASLLGGSLLALYGFRRPFPQGLLWTALGAGLVYRGATGHCNLYATLGVSSAEPRGRATSVPAGHGLKVAKSIHIDRPAQELYSFWRHLENLPRFMRHLRSVSSHGKRSHWVAQGLLGAALAWDAEIIADEANRLIAWRSLPGADVDSAGSVHFEPTNTGWGTRVSVELKYDPPAGRVGITVARLLGHDAGRQLEEDLRRFKQLMETGELATTRDQPHGRSE